MINFNRRNRIHPCYLTKEDLKELVCLIKTDFPESGRKEDFTIRTYSNTFDISEHSIDDFLNHRRLPSVLTKLIINIIGWSTERKIDKDLEITFYDNYIDFKVSGASESWVNGKYLQIVGFLRTKKPMFWFLHPATYVIRGGIFVVLIGSATFLAIQWFKEGFGAINILTPLSIVFLSLLDSIIGKNKYTQIFITERQSFSDKYKDLITVITIIGVLFTIVGVVIMLL